jgi:transcriptional regulator with XRE-family HTH domain
MARLERQRKDLGMTYRIVAERSGVKYHTVLRIFKCKHDKICNLIRVAGAMFMEFTVTFDGGPERKLVCEN